MPSNNTTRRRTLKAIGATTTGLAAFETPSVGRLPRNKRIVVVRGGSNDEAILTKKVPARWLAHERALKRVQKRVVREYLDEENVVGGALVNADRSVDGFSFSEIQIELVEGASEADLQRLPDSIEETDVAVPSDVVVSSIRKRRREGELSLHGCYGDHAWTDSFYGGQRISSSSGIGTSGFRIYHQNKLTYFMMTANHVLAPGNQLKDPTNCTGGKGVDAYDWDSDLVGTGTGENNVEHDWILMKEQTKSFGRDILISETNLRQVDGYVNDDGISTLQSNNSTVEAFGNATGYESGEITESGKYVSGGCIFMSFKGVQTSINTAPGDSGGPIYADWDGGVTSVIGMKLLGTGDSWTITVCGGDEVSADPSTITYPVWRIINNNPYYIADGVTNP